MAAADVAAIIGIAANSQGDGYGSVNINEEGNLVIPTS